MLNFDESRYRAIQAGALALAEPIHAALSQLIADGGKNLFFLGAGGAGVLASPAAQLLQRRSSFPTQLQNAAELVAVDSDNLGEGSIAVIPSLSGTTPEAIEVAAFAQRKGARVIALTAHADSPLATMADVSLTNFAEDDTSSESFYLQTLLVALSVLEIRGEVIDYARIVGELRALPDLLLQVKSDFEPRAATLAESIKDESYHIITGAGSTWPAAWYYGTCILEEMQWIRTRPVHASDFFHGTLELVEKGVSVIIMKGEDDARALTERVERFAPRVTDVYTVLDTKEFELAGISDDVRGLISPVVLAAMLERLSAHLEVVRRHPLVVRRYYKRVEY